MLGAAFACHIGQKTGFWERSDQGFVRMVYPEPITAAGGRSYEKLAVPLWWHFYLMRQFVAIFSSHGVPDSHLKGTQLSKSLFLLPCQFHLMRKPTCVVCGARLRGAVVTAADHAPSPAASEAKLLLSSRW